MHRIALTTEEAELLMIITNPNMIDHGEFLKKHYEENYKVCNNLDLDIQKMSIINNDIYCKLNDKLRHNDPEISIKELFTIKKYTPEIVETLNIYFKEDVILNEDKTFSIGCVNVGKDFLTKLKNNIKELNSFKADYDSFIISKETLGSGFDTIVEIETIHYREIYRESATLTLELIEKMLKVIEQ